MPLPTGTWKVNVNGTEGNLTIEAPDRGVFVGKVLEMDVRGFWDESSQTIAFMAITGQPALGGFVVRSYKGYLFRTPPNPERGRDVLATLSGSLQVNALAPGDVAAEGGDARRNVFGWFAQIVEIV
jgi:hypothetical protein